MIFPISHPRWDDFKHNTSNWGNFVLTDFGRARISFDIFLVVNHEPRLSQGLDYKITSQAVEASIPNGSKLSENIVG